MKKAIAVEDSLKKSYYENAKCIKFAAKLFQDFIKKSTEN